MELMWWIVKLLLLAETCVCSLERVEHNPENTIICPQTECRLRNTDSLIPPDKACSPAYVCSLTVKPKLCCYMKNCKPCLWSNIKLSVIPDPEYRDDDEKYESEEYGESGDWDSGCVSMPNDTTDDQNKENSLCEHQMDYQAAHTICYSSAERLQDRCKRLEFKPTSPQILSMTLVEYEDVDFGRTMMISVGSVQKKLEVPSLKTVCSAPHLHDIKQCKGPIIHTETQDGLVKVLLDKKDERNSAVLNLCVKRGREGKCWSLSNNSIPLESITNCMCFQAWKEDYSVRSEICPFQNRKTPAIIYRNISVSLALVKTNDGEPMLSYNLSTPCRITAELWPCQLQADGQCKEIKGFRQHCCKNWAENETTLWASGTFVNISSRNHKHLCVMLEVDDESVRHCQQPLERQYWSLLIILLILICLMVVGALLLVNKLRWSLSDWDRKCHSQDKRGQVLLLHSSMTSPQLVGKLGQLLSELGFVVFLDLWNQSELGSHGPAAWLHSKLDHIQKCGGKVLLLLSPSVLQRAEWYWNIAVERLSNPDMYWSDTLATALGCIFADHQKGGAVQRFILVRFDSDELLINEENDLPKLLRRLSLYKLPSEAQGLLKELCLEKPNNLSGKLKKMWWMKRAQRKLAQGVQNMFKKTRLRTESMLTQLDSLSLDLEDTEERVSLRNTQL